MHFVLRRRQVAQRFHQARAVVPGHPFQRGILDVLEPPPRAEMVDDLGLVEPVDGLGERVVIRITPTAHRGVDAGDEQAIRVADGEILRAAVAVMHERAIEVAVVQRLLQGVEREVRAQGGRRPPADDAP